METQAVKCYFKFEEDFVEQDVRCIPMVVRFKLDACGIKLRLAEWNKMNVAERERLASKPCETADEISAYRLYLTELIYTRTGNMATEFPIVQNPAWDIQNEIPFSLQEKLKEFEWCVSIEQWRGLARLQRFALLKLSYPGHENRNFPKAMKEFGLV